MIIILNERVLETLLSIGFHLVEDGKVGYWTDGSPKYGFKIAGPRYLTRDQSKKMASSVMKNYADVNFSINYSVIEASDRIVRDYLVEYCGITYNLRSIYERSPHYLFFIEALRAKAFNLIYNNPQWAKFIQEL